MRAVRSAKNLKIYVEILKNKGPLGLGVDCSEKRGHWV